MHFYLQILPATYIASLADAMKRNAPHFVVVVPVSCVLRAHAYQVQWVESLERVNMEESRNEKHGCLSYCASGIGLSHVLVFM